MRWASALKANAAMKRSAKNVFFTMIDFFDFDCQMRMPSKLRLSIRLAKVKTPTWNRGYSDFP
jgi:hypothetical protein